MDAPAIATGTVGSAVIDALAGRGEPVARLPAPAGDTPSAPTAAPVAAILNDLPPRSRSRAPPVPFS